jgi:uncharacterized membrane protein
MSGSPTSNPSDTGLSSNVAAGLCAVFPLIGGIVFYFIEKKDQLVRHWAVQSIFFGATWFVVWVALSIVNQILIHVPILGILLVLLLGLVFSLGSFILWLLGVIKAFQGTRWEYPVISEQCKKLFPKMGE